MVGGIVWSFYRYLTKPLQKNPYEKFTFQWDIKNLADIV